MNKQLNRQTFGKGFFYTIYSVKMLILFFSVVQLVPLAEYARTFLTPEAVHEEIKIMPFSIQDLVAMKRL
ncbi:hypothetical protein QUB72_02850 [Enterococcus faecium]|nr:hypothetical protein [Enterococcus faecium]